MSSRRHGRSAAPRATVVAIVASIVTVVRIVTVQVIAHVPVPMTVTATIVNVTVRKPAITRPTNSRYKTHEL